MVEKILENVVNVMVPNLEHLKNVLYINFHGKEVCDQCTDLVARGKVGTKPRLRCL